jgi:hypothetical protein
MQEGWASALESVSTRDAYSVACVSKMPAVVQHSRASEREPGSAAIGTGGGAFPAEQSSENVPDLMPPRASAPRSNAHVEGRSHSGFSLDVWPTTPLYVLYVLATHATCWPLEGSDGASGDGGGGEGGGGGGNAQRTPASLM